MPLERAAKIKTHYGGNGFVMHAKDNAFGSYHVTTKKKDKLPTFWKNNLSCSTQFGVGLVLKTGNGMMFSFWHDCWITLRPLATI